MPRLHPLPVRLCMPLHHQRAPSQELPSSTCLQTPSHWRNHSKSRPLLTGRPPLVFFFCERFFLGKVQISFSTSMSAKVLKDTFFPVDLSTSFRYGFLANFTWRWHAPQTYVDRACHSNDKIHECPQEVSHDRHERGVQLEVVFAPFALGSTN